MLSVRQRMALPAFALCLTASAPASARVIEKSWHVFSRSCAIGAGAQESITYSFRSSRWMHVVSEHYTIEEDGSRPAIHATPASPAGVFPQPELGKVHVLELDRLPPELRSEALFAIEGATVSPWSDLRTEQIEEDDWVWPLPADSLYPDLARMNQGKLEIAPCDLSRTELAGYRFLGFEDNDANPGEPVSTVTRQFQRPDGVIVALTENDLSGHGAVVVVAELVREHVSNWPAAFTVQRTSSGRTRSVIDWAHDGRDFTLVVLDDVRLPRSSPRYDKEWMFRLAEAIEHAPQADVPVTEH